MLRVKIIFKFHSFKHTFWNVARCSSKYNLLKNNILNWDLFLAILYICHFLDKLFFVNSLLNYVCQLPSVLFESKKLTFTLNRYDKRNFSVLKSQTHSSTVLPYNLTLGIFSLSQSFNIYFMYVNNTCSFWKCYLHSKKAVTLITYCYHSSPKHSNSGSWVTGDTTLILLDSLWITQEQWHL